MKGKMLISWVAATAVAMAAEYEVTPLVGVMGNVKDIKTEKLLGAEFQYNDVDTWLKPELALLYTPEADYKHIEEETSIFRAALNGVYDFEAISKTTPFVKVGLGYESVDQKEYDNDSGVFANAGVGLKSILTENIAFKLELLGLTKERSDELDVYWGALAGLTFSFGSEGPKTVASAPIEKNVAKKKVVKAAPVPQRDSDRDGVFDSMDQCPQTARGMRVDHKGCALDSDQDGVMDGMDQCPTTPRSVRVDTQGCALDSDKDGILDGDDRCPKTPKGFSVDTQGCPVTMELSLTFETASSVIDAVSTPKVHRFAEFLKENPGYKAHVIGHTDSRGAAAMNQKLSENRAASVRTMLIQEGVQENRVTAEGKGEAQPKADNTTAQGREANRRIEVQLRK